MDLASICSFSLKPTFEKILIPWGLALQNAAGPVSPPLGKKEDDGLALNVACIPRYFRP